MSKVAEWLIATFAAVILGYILVEKMGLPVWAAAVVGVYLMGMGVVLLGKKDGNK